MQKRGDGARSFHGIHRRIHPLHLPVNYDQVDDNGKRYTRRAWEVRTGLERAIDVKKPNEIVSLVGFFSPVDGGQKIVSVEPPDTMQGFGGATFVPPAPFQVDSFDSNVGVDPWVLLLAPAPNPITIVDNLVDQNEGVGCLQVGLNNAGVLPIPWQCVIGKTYPAPMNMLGLTDIRLDAMGLGTGGAWFPDLQVRFVDAGATTEVHPLIVPIGATYPAWATLPVFPLAGFVAVDLTQITQIHFILTGGSIPANEWYFFDDMRTT